MTKIAICYSGQLRTFSDSLIYSLNDENTELDFYGHTWYPKNGIYTNTGLIGIQKDIAFDWGLFQKLSFFKKITLEKEHSIPLVDNFKEFEYVDPTHVMPMWKSIQNAYRMIENPHEYDYIIRTRYDLDIQKKINLNNFLDGYINSPYAHHTGIMDSFWVCTPQVADKIFNIYEILSYLGVNGVGENILKAGCDFHKINLRYFDEQGTPYYNILRQ